MIASVGNWQLSVRILSEVCSVDLKIATSCSAHDAAGSRHVNSGLVTMSGR